MACRKWLIPLNWQLSDSLPFLLHKRDLWRSDEQASISQDHCSLKPSATVLASFFVFFLVFLLANKCVCFLCGTHSIKASLHWPTQNSWVDHWFEGHLHQMTWCVSAPIGKQSHSQLCCLLLIKSGINVVTLCLVNVWELPFRILMVSSKSKQKSSFKCTTHIIKFATQMKIVFSF